MEKLNGNIKKIFFVIIVVAAVCFGLFLWSVATSIQWEQNQGNILASVAVEARNWRFEVEVANTSRKMKRGLSGRSELAENQGMLFVFNQSGLHSFWMKDMLFPIDIIWIDENKEVVFMKRNAQPCAEEYCSNILPNEKAKYVLEIKTGVADEINLKIGDKLDFNIMFSDGSVL